jgi:hypothetical protein
VARIRSVHPGLFTDEAFVSLSEAAQILLIGIWTEADDNGIFEWKPIQLRMRLRPTKDGDIELLLTELARAGALQKFMVGERAFGAVRNFLKYQSPRRPKILYPCPDHLLTYVGLGSQSAGMDEPDLLLIPTNAATDEVEAPPFPTNTGIPRQREGRGGERKGVEGKDCPRSRAPPARRSKFPEAFRLSDAGRQFAVERGFQNSNQMFERFRDYHIAKGSLFQDWEAAWRTWVNNQVKFDGDRSAANSEAKPRVIV